MLTLRWRRREAETTRWLCAASAPDASAKAKQVAKPLPVSKRCRARLVDERNARAAWIRHARFTHPADPELTHPVVVVER
jgi:hypothetical protein